MSRFRLLLSLFALCGLPVCAAEPATGAGSYLFSYFKGNGEDGLHLAASRDGLKWESLNDDRPLTSPAIGGKLMRDPSIVCGPDGVYHMVWSSGWWDLGFGYASSKNQIHWSEHRFIPVNQSVKGAKNTWAPDLFYDEASQQFVIIFATTIPGRFPETDQGGDHNHRMYSVTTKDFATVSPPVLCFDPGFNCIDGTLIKMNDRLTLVYKDERPGHKRLHAATTSAWGKSWSTPMPPILHRDWVEGPTVLKVGSSWMLYFDCYQKGHYGAAKSDDGNRWTDITDTLTMPNGARHGTAFAVPAEVLEPLLRLKP